MMTKRQIAYGQIILLLSSGDDEIFLETDMEKNVGEVLRLHFRVPRDTGAGFVKTKFGCPPDRTIDVRVLPDE